MINSSKLKKFFSIFNILSLKKEAEKLHKLKTRLLLPSNLLSSNYYNSNLKHVFDYSFPSQINEKSVIIKEIPYSEDLKSTPFNSFFSLCLDFPKEEKLRNHFCGLNNSSVRLGKLLELFDFLTSESCFKHIGKPKNEFTLVTASVSSIEFFKRMEISKPLIMNTYLTSVGKTSMEVRIDLFDNFECSDEGFYGSAYFTFVARDKIDYTQSMKVPILKGLSSDYEFLRKDDLYQRLYSSISEMNNEIERIELRNELGVFHKDIQKKESLTSLYKYIPTIEEITTLHNLFLDKKNNWSNFSSNSISIQSTKTEKVLLNYREHANYNGHVFGGFLMREGFELCYACIKLFDPKLEYKVEVIHTVNFYKPVLLSSISHLKAYVTYKEGDLLHTNVEIFNILNSNKTDSSTLTTVLSITFRIINNSNDINKINIYPEGYECGIRYLEGKRKVQKMFDLI